jgi:antitoxin CptB
LDREHHLKRLGFRAWHRGTREADYMIGGFFDRYAAAWSDEDVAWFERLIEQEDVDIMAWAMGKEPVPAVFDGPLMLSMQKLDYISIH